MRTLALSALLVAGIAAPVLAQSQTSVHNPVAQKIFAQIAEESRGDK